MRDREDAGGSGEVLGTVKRRYDFTRQRFEGVSAALRADSDADASARTSRLGRRSVVDALT